MEGDFIKINKWLLPFSKLYGFGVRLRNLLFETNVLKSRSFDMPVISVGNITVGGSGKTPHVEYLIRLLHNDYRVAVLSRGYKRNTKGYVVTGYGIKDAGMKGNMMMDAKNVRMQDIGDEPYQMLQKFPDIRVAVDRDRCHGIDTLQNDYHTKDTEVVLLDDAFQHRYVKPGVNILLVDYHRLIIYDELLPAGRLREPQEGKRRAEVVIVTKCPKDVNPMGFRVLQRTMNLEPWQKMFFTTIDYCQPVPLFDAPRVYINKEGGVQLNNVLLLTGIASPEQMIKDLSPYCNNIQPLSFADHHQFTPSDAEAINMAFKMMKKPAVIITTEKDATRLKGLKELSKQVRKALYVLPIEIQFMLDEEEKFNEYIKDYVRKNTKHGSVAQG